MNSRIDEEDEEDEDDEDDEGGDGDGDGEEGDGEEELSHQEDSDGLSHDRSLLTTGDESDASPPLPLPQHTGKRRNLLPSSPSSSSLGQGARVGLIGALGAMFSASAATTSRAQKRVNKSKLTAEEILLNKLKVDQQLKLGIVICMYVCI